MAVPKLSKQEIVNALKFIDEKGVPEHNVSMKYVLVSENGKTYPPKYVVAVADHLANGTDISTESFGSEDARNCLERLGFAIETKRQEKFELTVTAQGVVSTDERFTMDDLSLGDNYVPLGVCFQRANGDIIKRDHRKGEKKISNMTLPRLACQIFEKRLPPCLWRRRRTFPFANTNRAAR